MSRESKTFPMMTFREWLAWKLIQHIRTEDLKDYVHTMEILERQQQP